MIPTSELKKMSKKEKLILMEQVWESLLHEDSEIDSPQWHEKILKERLRKVKNGEAKFITIDELRKTS